MPEQDQERCIEEITEDDMMGRLLCQEEHGHRGEAGKFVSSEREIGVCLGATRKRIGRLWDQEFRRRWDDQEGRRIWDQEERRSRDGQESQRIGEDRDWKDRDGKASAQG